MSHLSIKAGAGTGKTTTIVEGAKLALGYGTEFKPSTQQAAIWDHLKRLITPQKKTRFLAFNKSIATELGQRLPSEVPASTLHSLGLKAVTKKFGSVQVEGSNVKYILEDQFRVDPKKDGDFLYPMAELVSLAKVTLTDASNQEQVEGLIDHYGVELNGNSPRAIELLPQVLDYCRKHTRKIDFDDMVWLPAVLGLPVERTDVALVDERQDLNLAQQTLVLSAADLIVGVGDERQAIYGFAGADAEAFSRLSGILAASPAGLVELPLMQTRRCPKRVVDLVKHIVPDFEALPEAPEGEIYPNVSWDVLTGERSHPQLGTIRPGDMVLCRVNAPLVSLCYRYLRQDIPAYISGRKIGQGLISLIRKSRAHTPADFAGWLSKYHQQEEARLLNRKRGVESALAALEDKIACLDALCEGQPTMAAVVSRIETLFQDSSSKGKVQLSSIHKAKGLEAERVWLACPELLPGPWAKQPWERVQEENLEYVAKTRTKSILATVPGVTAKRTSPKLTAR